VGNPQGAAALEVLLSGLRLRLRGDLMLCVTGADVSVDLDGEPMGMWAPFVARDGAILAVTARRAGARAYVAVAGGIDVPVVLGSRSTYLPGGWGGYGGRALREGDILTGLPYAGGIMAPRSLSPERCPAYSSFPTLRCVVGPHVDAFDPATLEGFFSATYHVSRQSDRMGYRLHGTSLQSRSAGTLASAGVLPGALQTPPHGDPILLMADAQVTGGYPIIATVIGADLPLAAQLLPGDRMRFRAVSVSEAIAVARKQRALLDAIGDEPDVVGVPV
jgi:antagonist of KipI